MLPAYTTLRSVDAGGQLWYPDFAATSHMTPDDGKLLSKSVYSGLSLVKIGNGTLVPIKHIGHSSISTLVKSLCLTYCPPCSSNKSESFVY